MFWISSLLSLNYFQRLSWIPTVCQALGYKTEHMYMSRRSSAWNFPEHIQRLPQSVACSSLPPWSLRCLGKLRVAEKCWKILCVHLKTNQEWSAELEIACNHDMIATKNVIKSGPLEFGENLALAGQISVSKISTKYLPGPRKNSSTQKESKLNNDWNHHPTVFCLHSPTVYLPAT